MNFDVNILTGLEWFVVAIGAVLLFMGVSKQGKNKKAGKTLLFIGIAALAVGLVLPATGNSILGGIALGGGLSTGGSGSNGAGATCNVEDTTVTLSSTDAFTSSATGAVHRYRINGNPALTVSDAGTFTASPGDEIEILWGNESSGSYYGNVATESVPCAGTKTFSSTMYQNGTLTVRVFNEEGNLIDTAGENETLANGDVVSLRAELQGQFQRGFPHGAVMVVEYNKTTVDDVVVQLGGSATNVPSVHSSTLGTDSTMKAYEIPAILSNAVVAGSIVIDADDSSNPLAIGSDVLLTFYPKDYFVNEDTGGSYSGPAVEDEDSTRTFGHSTAFTLNID